MRVQDVINPCLSSVDEDTPISCAWELMQLRHIRHLPVWTTRHMVGMLTDRDLLCRASRSLDGVLHFPDLCVAEVMTLCHVSCAPDEPLEQVAKTMVEKKLDAMPVISHDKLVGIVTRSDLLKLLVSSAARA